jgi:transcriptional regulator with XRE-family HTH domain
MLIGQRLKELREEKGMSQLDIEKETGLIRHYVSRIENGHTIPSIETLEKWARAFKIPLYQIFYEAGESYSPPKSSETDKQLWGYSGKDAAQLNRLRKSLARMNPWDRDSLLGLAVKMVSK